MRAAIGKGAVIILGLMLVAGCGRTEKQQTEQPPDTPGSPVAPEQGDRSPEAPRVAAAQQPGQQAEKSPGEQTPPPRPEAEIELPASQSVTLHAALREGVIDRQTYDRVEAELRTLAEARAASPQAGGPATEEEIEENIAEILRELSIPKALPGPDELPPIRIRARADEDGSLKGVLLGGRMFASPEQLSPYLREILGVQSHLQSISESLAIELDCDPELRTAHLLGLLEALGGVLRGNGVARFARGLKEIRYPWLYVFSIGGKSTPGDPALAVSVQMTANQDGSLRAITVQKDIELGGDLKRLGKTLAEVVEVAGLIEKANRTGRKARIDLHCDGRLRSGYVPGVIVVLGRYDLLKSIESLDLVELKASEGPRGEHRVSLRNLRQRIPEDMIITEEFDDLEELEEEPLEELDLSELESPVELMEEPKIPPADDEAAAAIEVELEDLGPKYGGTAGSEKAVAKALKWLAEHQMPDGGWSFDHGLAPGCKGKCRNPGDLHKARNAATAMALLPFLGAGQTHKDGKYKRTVRSGLYFLVSRIKMGSNGGSLWEDGGRMYSHGLASIVLCEAYAMTRDKGLHRPAQAAVNFICYAQDPVGGGWRYQPRQKGDTSVTGWQFTALKSGHMAYLNVPAATVQRAVAFLDTVQFDGGAQYGYLGPEPGTPATTAMGLLSRMYLGWKKDNPALRRGVKWLSEKGPSKTNLYYNYYATQVMRHWEGEEWKKWNSVIRDQMVNSQATEGHEAGSWFVAGDDPGSRRGGRLYCTSMATLILEVYYRHLPIYRTQMVEEALPR